MSNLSEIVNNYINGDNQAVADLYACLKDRLLLTAYNFCRNKEISRDVVQVVFEKMILLPIKKRSEYFGNSEDNIEAYLSVAVKNKCIDVQRIKVNREKIIYSIRHLFTAKVENSSLERFCQDGLREMLKNLQPREQEIISLHLEGYTNDEIAAQLNISYNTVKNNIYESKKKLKSFWNLFMN
ncbi:MAG: sigma-70 family RNA polymerase sigma factor [Chitinophagaceae bacterium]|nr:sigma-70 family RNA polymerase sigma factor [Chitinophagaceae bacterium]